MRLLALLGCVLLLPSLWLGFASDDHFLLAATEGAIEGVRPWFELYDFVPKDRALFAERLTHGAYPWWSALDLSLTFFRPLSSLLFGLDHQVFGRDAWGYHLHCLLWLLLLLAAFARLLRRLVPPRVALLAYAFLCLDNAHAMATYWISNRHSLVGSALSFWALEAHLDHVQRGRRGSFALALLGFTGALAASEFSLSCIVFALALDACDMKRPLRARLVQSAAWLLPCASYVVLYLWLGRGASGSAAYISPAQIGPFAEALVSRLPALFLDLLVNVPAIWWVLGTAPRVVQGLLAASALGLLILLWQQARGAMRASRSPALNALVAGALLSLVPAACALPGSRQLLGASFGVAPLLATLILETRELARERKAPRFAEIGAILLLLSHLVVAPILVLWGQLAFRDVEATLRRVSASLDDIPRCTSPEVNVVLLNAPDHLVGVYLPIVRRTLGLSSPRSFHVLSMAPFDQTLEVQDRHTVKLAIHEGAFLRSEIERFWRTDPLAPGSAISLDGFFTVRALSRSSDTRIDTLETTFERTLDDPSWCLVRYVHGRFERVPLAAPSMLKLVKEAGPSGL